MGVQASEDENVELSPTKRLAAERAESISVAEVIEMHKVFLF
jgi:hypothetical protein